MELHCTRETNKTKDTKYNNCKTAERKVKVWSHRPPICDSSSESKVKVVDSKEQNVAPLQVKEETPQSQVLLRKLKPGGY